MALTPKQEAFAQLLVNGVNQSDAYRRAGYGGDSNGATINNHAYALAHHDDVVARVRELRACVRSSFKWV